MYDSRDYPHSSLTNFAQVCNGEQVFGFGNIKTGQCYSVAEYRASGSIAATDFGKNRRLNFFFNDDCTDQVAHAISDQCYVHTQTGVKSFKLKKT